MQDLASLARKILARFGYFCKVVYTGIILDAKNHSILGVSTIASFCTEMSKNHQIFVRYQRFIIGFKFSVKIIHIWDLLIQNNNTYLSIMEIQRIS